MKMMDINGQNDCHIEAVTPAKRKKMKQAQLTFQMTSPAGSPNVVQSKKRKLTSPAVETKSPKAVKISKRSSKKDVLSSKSSNDDPDAKNISCDSVEIIEVVETENAKENATSNKVESKSMTDTPKRSSTGQRKLEKQEKLKSSPLAKFFQKTEKHEETPKECDQNSVEWKDESDKESPDTKSATKLSQSTSNLSSEAGDSFMIANDSLCQSDSDAVILSSDNEDKDEEANTERTTMDSPQITRTPKTDTLKQRKLTPKQQEKKVLSGKKKEERQRLKMEKERKLEEERQNRRREKEEKRKEKEERERAEKEQKMMEKKMKEQKKQMEIEQKQKEKQAKEEERRKREEAKEEEKRKKEEEKLEAERKKQKAASNFTSFFVAKKQEKSVEDESTTEVKNFMPFEVKADMKVAPVCRRTLTGQEKSLLDEKCNEGCTQLSDLYISELKDKRNVPRKSFTTWPLEAKDDVLVLDDENDGNSNIVSQNVVIENQRAKLLQFSENQRPPYWGTWRKRSSHINPRRPFTKDPKWFNYEVDSDEEWEEEEPGESLHGSDDEKDEENPEDNEYDVDNEFMVPHGYLSDEEVRADEEEKEDMSPETQKYKLKVLGEQFESERNTKTSKLKPKIIGCIWRGLESKFASNVPQRTIDFLTAREAWVRQIPAVLPTMSENDATKANECSTPTHQQATTNWKKTRVPEEALPDLIRLVHGNMHGRRFLVKEFMTHWGKKDETSEKQISKASLLQKIREIGSWQPCPEEGPMHKKTCWYIPEGTRKKYVDEELLLPNKWSYSLSPKRKGEFSEAAEKLEKEDKEKERDKDKDKDKEKERERKHVPLITQFTKKITQEEMKKQLTVKPVRTTPKSDKTVPTKPPKRATLISVARGEQFSKALKESLAKTIDSADKRKNVDSSKNKGAQVDVVNLDSSREEVVDDKQEEAVKSVEKKETEDRLAVLSVDLVDEARDKQKVSDNVENDKHNGGVLSKVECNGSTEKDPSSKGAKGTVDTPMEVDD